MVKVSAYDKFRFCIFATDFRHDGRTLFIIPDIHIHYLFVPKFTLFRRIFYLLFDKNMVCLYVIWPFYLLWQASYWLSDNRLSK